MMILIIFSCHVICMIEINAQPFNCYVICMLEINAQPPCITYFDYVFSMRELRLLFHIAF